MELAYGRAIFDTCGRYAADPAAIVAMLEDAVTDMQARAARLAGKQRDHTPTAEYPFVVVLVDEVAFLTAYQPDKQLRERVKAALATLTTQGRAVGLLRGGRVAGPAQGGHDASATCSRTGSRCGWTSRSRWTWCSATAPATAAQPPT